MSTTAPTELERFHAFIGEQISNGGLGYSPEEILDRWRAENPTSDEIEKSVAAIQEVIADVEAGDVGRDAQEVIADLRKKHGISK